jgi:hypothetical protein
VTSETRKCVEQERGKTDKNGREARHVLPVPRLLYILAGADDRQYRIFNYTARVSLIPNLSAPRDRSDVCLWLVSSQHQKMTPLTDPERTPLSSSPIIAAISHLPLPSNPEAIASKGEQIFLHLGYD